MMVSSNASYSAIFMMPIFDVADNFLTKSAVYSPTFTCYKDPHQTSFQIVAEFKEDQMDVFVNPTSRDVCVKRATFNLFDKDMTRLEKARLTHVHGPFRKEIYCSGPNRGFHYSFLRPLPDGVQWTELRLMVDIRYSAKLRDRSECVEALGLDIWEHLYEFGLDFDFCIRVEDEEINCHKVTLLC